MKERYYETFEKISELDYIETVREKILRKSTAKEAKTLPLTMYGVSFDILEHLGIIYDFISRTNDALVHEKLAGSFEDRKTSKENKIVANIADLYKITLSKEGTIEIKSPSEQIGEPLLITREGTIKKLTLFPKKAKVEPHLTNTQKRRIEWILFFTNRYYEHFEDVYIFKNEKNLFSKESSLNFPEEEILHLRGISY